MVVFSAELNHSKIPHKSPHGFSVSDEWFLPPEVQLETNSCQRAFENEIVCFFWECFDKKGTFLWAQQRVFVFILGFEVRTKQRSPHKQWMNNNEMHSLFPHTHSPEFANCILSEWAKENPLSFSELCCGIFSRWAHCCVWGIWIYFGKITTVSISGKLCMCNTRQWTGKVNFHVV